jgi:hypothetical protein
MDKLAGKFALIPGGTSGIGLATAKLFSAEGATVIITGRRRDVLASAHRDVADGTAFWVEPAKITELDKLFERVQVEFRHPKILFGAGARVPRGVQLPSGVRILRSHGRAPKRNDYDRYRVVLSRCSPRVSRFTVIGPSAVTNAFSTVILDNVEIRVTDSTLVLRFLVLPLRPKGTDDYTEETLAAIVTRDAMIGVIPARRRKRRCCKSTIVGRVRFWRNPC